MSKTQVQKYSALLGLRTACFITLLVFISGCATFEYHETSPVAASRLDDASNEEIAEEELLDVGIIVFDPGIDDIDPDALVYESVRQSEAVWFASQLKATLQHSNVWGSIRTMPNANSVMDVQVDGKIVESNGEIVSLLVTVKDATGKQWFSKQYEQSASSYAYNPEVNYNRDPFRNVFVQIANDMFDYRVNLTSQEILTLRSVSKVRFAQDFLPQAYDDFIVETKDGFQLQRIPAANDPMIKRIERIRARNDLFLDVIQDYYRAFNGNMAHPYQEWRKASYKEVIYARQLKQQARNEKIAGVTALLAGILAQTSSSRYARGAGHIGIFSGANLIVSGYGKQNTSLLHSATLRELSSALEAELEPSIIDLEDRSVTLSGTVDEQFKEWRRILAEMFEAESGVPIERGNKPSQIDTTNSTIDTPQSDVSSLREGELASPDPRPTSE